VAPHLCDVPVQRPRGRRPRRRRPQGGHHLRGVVPERDRAGLALGRVERGLDAWRVDGTPLPGFPVPIGDPYYGQKASGDPVVGDVDGDQRPDIVVVAKSADLNSSRVLAYDAQASRRQSRCCSRTLAAAPTARMARASSVPTTTTPAPRPCGASSARPASTAAAISSPGTLLNRPGSVGGSIAWKGRWSHGRQQRNPPVPEALPTRAA
jgi:hypothetical protein